MDKKNPELEAVLLQQRDAVPLLTVPAQGRTWLARERWGAHAAALPLGWQLTQCCAGAGAHLKPATCPPLDRTQTSLSFLVVYEGLGLTVVCRHLSLVQVLVLGAG